MARPSSPHPLVLGLARLREILLPLGGQPHLPALSKKRIKGQQLYCFQCVGREQVISWVARNSTGSCRDTVYIRNEDYCLSGSRVDDEE
jgi:hypothetical protein